MDLIDREALLEALDELDSCQTMSRYQSRKELAIARFGISLAVDRVIEQSIVEAEPVRHGKWIRQHIGDGWNDWDSLTCSECNFYIEKPQFVGNYCPNCGAKMEG